MKVRNNLLFKSPALSLVMITLSFNLMAQQQFGDERTVINNNNAVVNTQPIEVDGYLKEEAPVTDQELEEVSNELYKQKNAIEINRKKKDSYRDLQKTTKTLTKSTEKYLKERSSAKKDIDAYNKKLECLMETENPELCKDVADQVKNQQAATHKVETTTGSTWGSTGMDRVKILPYFGSTAYLTGNDQDQLFAQFKTGAIVEADFGSRFSGGIGFSYSQLRTQDFGDNYFGNFNPLFRQGREIRFRNMTIDGIAKYSIYRSDRIRMYAGVNASINFAKIQYENNQNQFGGFGNPYQVGNEELFSNFFSLGLNVGTEFFFTQSMGMNLDLGYSKGIGGQFNSRNGQNAAFFPDQRRLQQLGDEIASAHAFSLTVGMLIAF